MQLDDVLEWARDGTIHTFTTNCKRTDKRVYSFRLTENGAAKVRAMQKKGLLK